MLWNVTQPNTVFAAGKAILNRTANTNIGVLMLEYGGGGHWECRHLPGDRDMADDVLGALIKRTSKDGWG